jgi:type VI secretion system secreted protein VgrG
MPISTKTTIEIAGEKLTRFTRLVIDSKVQTHHRFSVLQPISKEFIGQAIAKSQSYIGKEIKISVEANNLGTKAPLVFYGIITEAQMVRASGAAGGIIINGYSPSIIMEGTPNIKSFSDKNLTDIIQEVTNKYSQKGVKPNLNIQNDTTLPYTVQYGESDFGFIARMAQKKGQWFYFNGEETVFGKPKSKTFNLEYGQNLQTFNVEMRAKSLNFEYLGYDASSAETQTVGSTQINYQPTGYSANIFEASKKLFPNTSTLLYSHPINEGNAQTHLTDRVSTQLHARAADLVTAKGESDETGLRIGDVISIQESAFSSTGNPFDGIQEQNFGSYIITDIVHMCDETGSYHNSFDAIPSTVISPPYGNVHSHPKADTQPAKVTNNNDPLGLGRVQVQFAWQTENTPWLRLTNPHAGAGKGMYFVPEIGEEVLVAFENQNAEKPFVLGAMYNGSESSGYSTPGNDQKVIQTRSGTKIIMNDAIGSVFIEDPSGNTILLDGKGNMILNAPKNMTLNVGENLNINVGKNMDTSVGENKNTQVGENKTTNVSNKNSLKAKEYKQNIDENKTVTIGGDLKETTGTTTHKAISGDILIQSSGISKILGAIDAKVNKG